MWEAIKQLCPHAHPMHLLMDFEKAATNAFSHFWSNTLLKGCFFHLTQNIFRKIQAEGLQHEYQHNEYLALQMKLIHALAFVPPYDVLHLFGTVVQNGRGFSSLLRTHVHWACPTGRDLSATYLSHRDVELPF